MLNDITNIPINTRKININLLYNESNNDIKQFSDRNFNNKVEIDFNESSSIKTNENLFYKFNNSQQTRPLSLNSNNANKFKIRNSFNSNTRPLSRLTKSSRSERIEKNEINLIKGKLNEEDKKLNEEILKDDYEYSILSKLGDFEENKNYCVGENAVFNFQEKYKNIGKIIEANKLGNRENSMLTNFIENINELNLLPKKMGIVKYEGKPYELKLRIDENYAKALKEGLKNCKTIQKVDLSKNKMTEKESIAFFDNFTSGTKIIDFSGNIIGPQGISSLKMVLLNPLNRLMDLSLENNKITDFQAIDLFKSLHKNISLKKLNLSKNELTDNSTTSLRDLLKTNDSIEELYLHWNKITGKGGVIISEGILKNYFLKVLDLSWNNLGKGTYDDVEKLCKIITDNNRCLVHLDLSYNDYNFAQSKIVQKSLENNHSIFGFHFQGNYGFVDSKGNLIIEKNCKKLNVNNYKENERIFGIKPKNLRIKEENDLNICWICDGWKELQFKWINNKNYPINKCCIHFDFENYNPVLLDKESESIYFINRICPPEKIRFFYSINDIQTISNNSEKEKIISQDLNIKYNLTEINYIINENTINLIDEYYYPNVEAYPRIPDPVILEENQLINQENIKIKESPYLLDQTLFPNFKNNDIINLKKIFLNDWNISGLSKKFPNELIENNIKHYIFQIYPLLINCYKYLSSFTPIGNVFCVSFSNFYQFINLCNIIDNKILTLRDIEIKLTKINSKKCKNDLRNTIDPQKSLIRYQFLQILIEIGLEKASKLKKNNNDSIYEIEIRKIFTEKILPIILKYDISKWQNIRFINEDFSNILIKYKLFIENYILNRVLVKNNVNMYVYLDQFKVFCLEYGFYDKNIQDNDINLAFNLCTTIQINELQNDRHLKLNSKELIELLARLAEKMSLEPIGFEKKYDKFERENLPLYVKFEALLNIIYKKIFNINICNKSNFNTQKFEEDIKEIKKINDKSLKNNEKLINYFNFPQEINKNSKNKGNLLQEKLNRSFNYSIKINQLNEILTKNKS